LRKLYTLKKFTTQKPLGDFCAGRTFYLPVIPTALAVGG